MSEFAKGGFVSGPPVLVELDDDECILDRDGRCVREDQRHHSDPVDVFRWGSTKPVATVPGRCHHRACHVELVESVIDGTVVARLCRACDAQLPA